LGRYETGSDLYCFLFLSGYGHSAAEEGLRAGFMDVTSPYRSFDRSGDILV
jgi:hypothetical protein